VRADERGGGASAYGFAHDVVRQAVYGELSAPRRRLMHLRIVRALQALDPADGTVAADLAHHGALAGETATAARACLHAAADIDIDLERGAAAAARPRAEEALQLAVLLQRPSDVVLARVAVARAAHGQGDAVEVARQRAALAGAALATVSAQARAAVARLTPPPARREKRAP
jgi:hypothetical protein